MKALNFNLSLRWLSILKELQAVVSANRLRQSILQKAFSGTR